MKMKHKIFSLVLLICMLVTCMPATMKADETNQVKFTDTINYDEYSSEYVNWEWCINVNYTETYDYVNTEIFIRIVDYDNATKFDLNTMMLEALAGLEYAMTSEDYAEYYSEEKRASFDDDLMVVVNYVESDGNYMCRIPALSAELVTKLSGYNAELYIYTPEFEEIEWNPVTGASVFNVAEGTTDAIANRLKEVDVKYKAYHVQGADENVYASEILAEDFFSYNAETDREEDWSPEWETMYIAEKYLYTYNAEKDMFVLCEGDNLVSYQKYVITEPLEGGGYMQPVEYYNVVFEEGAFASGAGYYVVADDVLPESVTTEKKEPTPEPVPTPNPTPSTDIIVNTQGMKTEAEVTEAMNTVINSAEKGDVVKVEVPTDVKKIEKDALKNASEKGVSVVVAIDPLTNTNSDYIKWSFDTVDNPVDFVPTVKVDATVEAIDTVLESVTLPQTLKSTSVSFDHSGDLPGEAKVTLDIGSSALNGVAAPGDTVYLYFYNPALEKFELIGKTEVEEYGFATFTMTHCSDYIIATEELPAEIVSTTTSGEDTTPAPAPTTPADGATASSPKTGEVSVNYVAILFVACGIAAITMKKKSQIK